MRHDNDALNDPFITEGKACARGEPRSPGSKSKCKRIFYFFLQVSTCVSLPDFKRQQMAFVMINS